MKKNSLIHSNLTILVLFLFIFSFSDAFANALTKEEAKDAINSLSKSHQNELNKNFGNQWDNGELILGSHKMPFYYEVYGQEPHDGRSLYISMHGGGGTTAHENNNQWENQKRLYQPKEGVYFVPRAPTDTWNMWHQDYMDKFIELIIALAVIKENVNPNKVYIMGYSAGGDGVYQLGPRLADLFAAAAMSAGHPNDAHIENLINLPFAIYMGGNDSAYKRNEVAAEWGESLDYLSETFEGFYIHDVKIFEGYGHWMELNDAVSIPWMSKFKRNPISQIVIWIQDDVLRDNFYWLSVSGDNKFQNGEIVAYYENNNIYITEPTNVDSFTIGLNDEMVDLDKDISVYRNDKQIFHGKVGRFYNNIKHDIENMRDTELVFPAKLLVKGYEVFPYEE